MLWVFFFKKQQYELNKIEQVHLEQETKKCVQAENKPDTSILYECIECPSLYTLKYSNQKYQTKIQFYACVNMMVLYQSNLLIWIPAGDFHLVSGGVHGLLKWLRYIPLTAKDSQDFITPPSHES